MYINVGMYIFINNVTNNEISVMFFILNDSNKKFIISYFEIIIFNLLHFNFHF